MAHAKMHCQRTFGSTATASRLSIAQTVGLEIRDVLNFVICREPCWKINDFTACGPYAGATLFLKL